MNKVYVSVMVACMTTAVVNAATSVSYSASDSPGTSPDANTNSVDVWTVTGDGGSGRSYFSDKDGNVGTWAIWDLSDQPGGTYARHTFAGGALTVGQSVSIDYAHNTNIDGGKRTGIRLLNGSNVEVEYGFEGNSSLDHYQKYDTGSGTYAYTDKQYDNKDIYQVVFTLLDSNTYGMTVTQGSQGDGYKGDFDGYPVVGNVVAFWTGTFTGSGIDGIEVFTEGGNESDQYFDNLIVSADIEPPPFWGITVSPSGLVNNSQPTVQAVIEHGASMVDTAATILSIDGVAVGASFDVTSSDTTVSYIPDLANGVHTGQVDVVGNPSGAFTRTWTFEVVLNPKFQGFVPAVDAGSAALATPIGLEVVFGTYSISTNDVTLTLDGTNVPPSFVVASNSVTMSYQPASPFAPGSVHNVSVGVTDANSGFFATNWSFTVEPYPATLPITLIESTTGTVAVAGGGAGMTIWSSSDSWLDGNYGTNSARTLYTRFTMKFNDLAGETGSGGGFGGLHFYRDGTEIMIVGNGWVSTNWSIDVENQIVTDLAPTTPVVLGEWHTMVSKIEFVPGADDQVTIWLDPDFSFPEDDLINTGKAITFSHDMSFNNVHLRCGNDTAAAEFTNIVMAATAADVGFNDGPASILGITVSPTGWITDSMPLVQAVIEHGASTVDTNLTQLSIDGGSPVAASFDVTSSNTTVSYAASFSHGVHTGQVVVVGTPSGGPITNTWTFQIVLEQSNPTSLLHHWDFDENGGTTVIDSVGGANGAIVGTNYGWVAGGLDLYGGGNSGDWNGFPANNTASSYVNLPDGIFSALPNVVTFEATYVVDVDHFWSRIWDFGTNTSNLNDVAGTGAQACYLGSGGPNVSVSDQSPQHVLFTVEGGGIVTGQLVHVVWVYDADNDMTKLYKNGVLADAEVITGWAPSNMGGLDVNCWFGRSQWTHDPMFEGKLDDIRIYSGIMTADEVVSRYNSLILAEAPQIYMIAVDGTDITLGWTDQGVGNYAVERKSALTDSSWTTVISNMPAAGGGGATTSFSDSSATGFYRIKSE